MIDDNPYAPPLTPPEVPEFSTWDKLSGCAFAVYVLSCMAFMMLVAPPCMLSLACNFSRMSPWMNCYPPPPTRTQDRAFIFVMILSVIEGAPYLPYYWAGLAMAFKFAGSLL